MTTTSAARRSAEPGLVSAIVVNYEGGEWLQRCLRSLYEQAVPLEIIVVDNGSSDGSAALAAERFPEVEVVRPGQNLGYAGGANAGARKARGAFLLFLNPDVELGPGCLQSLIQVLGVPGVGVVGPTLKVLASETFEHGATTDLVGHPIALTHPGTPLYVSGCALAIRSAVFQELGGFDGRYFMFVEDVDICWRALLAGYEVRVPREAFAVHVGGGSAPGGYPTRAGLVTSRIRVSLRQRNSLAMLLKCLGWPTFVPIVLASLVETLATAGALTIMGRWRTAGDVLRGLAWNIKELPRTLALRRQAQARRRVSDMAVLKRLRFTVYKAEILLRYGIPQVREV